MALTLDATVGGTTANTYCTLADANTYHEARLFTDVWDAADTDTRNRALAMATRLLDQFMSAGSEPVAVTQNPRLPANVFYAWTGSPASTTQALCWPRSGMVSRVGGTIATTDIPAALRDAVAEYASQLLGGDRSKDDDIETKGITDLKAGPVSLSFKELQMKKLVPDAVISMLDPSWYLNLNVQPVFRVL